MFFDNLRRTFNHTGTLTFTMNGISSLQETEEEVRSKTSNISLKVMKEGREMCDSNRAAFEQYKSSIANKGLQFVLHTFLASILEQIETFTMGEVKVIDLPDDDEDIGVDSDSRGNRELAGNPKLNRSKSLEPVNTSFSRSNSMDNSKAPLARSKSFQVSQLKSENASRAESRIAGLPNATSAANSRPQSKLGNAGPVKRNNKAMLKKVSETLQENESIRPVAGLNATFAMRTASEPLIKLLSKEGSIFISEQDRSDATMHPELGFRETLHTNVHKDACYITGITVLPNKNVVVCDNVHDCVQLYNPETRQVCELECDHPWGVAAVSDTAVAVTLHFGHKVLLVKANDQLERIAGKEITLKCKASLTYDIKYYAYRLYVLCVNGDIHVMDIKGKEFNLIRTGMLPNTLKFFDVDLETKRLVVSGDNGVACLNLEGLLQWSYRPRGKFVSTGVALSHGCVLVCDWENHCLIQIYEKGKKSTTVLGENLERPAAIHASTKHQLFFISQGEYDIEPEKSRAVKVFELV